MEEKIRLQKYLSQAGICSRRKAEEYIEKGLIKVNGEIAQIGQSVIPGVDKVELLEKAVEEQKKLVYYKLNKPRGIVTTCAQNGETNIIDVIDVKERVFPIGRLDKDTTGLILLTNDGRLANFLMHPRYEHQKEYIVEVFGAITDEALEKMSSGLFILGSYTKKAKIKRISSGKFFITITEGRNRQIRRMVEKVGFRVKKLKRIRIENIELGNLGIGEYKHLSKKEIDNLFKRLGLER
ncbi:rRNA pseudouridine synthase [Candidatus Gracilibacteria bacterium]|nr:MAG: rRNA pseudouridine synthase [Candidatus Gracilibacteria bacterium]